MLRYLLAAAFLFVGAAAVLRAEPVSQDTFTPVYRYDRPAPRWEVRASFLPFPVYDYSYFSPLQRVTEEDVAVGRTGRTYILNDGRTVSLNRGGWDNAPNNSDFYDRSRWAVAFWGAEVVHHRPSGIRLSLGGLFQREPRRSSDYLSGYSATVSEDRYLEFVTYNYQSVFAYVGAQYTINRRRRFRVHIGITVVGQILSSDSRQTVLYGGEPTQEHLVSRIQTNNANFLALVAPIPQLIFEYAITNDWSVSLGGGGSLGLGVGYRW